MQAMNRTLAPVSSPNDPIWALAYARIPTCSEISAMKSSDYIAPGNSIQIVNTVNRGWQSQPADDERIYSFSNVCKADACGSKNPSPLHASIARTAQGGMIADFLMQYALIVRVKCRAPRGACTIATAAPDRGLIDGRSQRERARSQRMRGRVALGAAFLGTAAMVAFVHYEQKRDIQRMRKSVFIDAERERYRRAQRDASLQDGANRDTEPKPAV